MPNKCLLCSKVPEEGESGWFSLPKDDTKRGIWVRATKLGDYYLTLYKPSWKICWLHFDPSQVKTDGQRRGLQKGVYFQLQVISLC